MVLLLLLLTSLATLLDQEAHVVETGRLHFGVVVGHGKVAVFRLLMLRSLVEGFSVLMVGFHWI